MSFRESRLPDFLGLRLDADPVNRGAVVAENIEFRKAMELSKRGGVRRLNHEHYSGAIVCLPDVQRICDYEKYLVISAYGTAGSGAEVMEHSRGIGGSPVRRFFDRCWAPEAHATGTPTTGVAPLSVDFSAFGSFDPEGGDLEYDWAFGDGSFDSGPVVSHQYATPGDFAAILTVTNSCGKTDTDVVNIHVDAPVAHWDGVLTNSVWEDGP